MAALFHEGCRTQGRRQGARRVRLAPRLIDLDLLPSSHLDADAIASTSVPVTECKEVVREYGEMILEMLVAQTRPQKVCSQIGLCVFDGSHSISNQIESVVNKKEKRGSDLLCTACEMIVVWIQNQLRKNQTEELILQYANQGPEICTGFLKDSKPIKLNQGQEITISTDYTIKGDETMISMSYQKLAIDVKPRSTILYYQKLEARVSASQRVDEAEDDENARMHMLRLAKVRPEQRTMRGCRPGLPRWSEAGTRRGEDGAARPQALLVEGEHASRRQGEYAVHQCRLRARRCDLFATGRAFSCCHVCLGLNS
ncbi:hypothetical protein ZWY2020_000173 [Hordeum vulgare]|nr:hypothetical protein ZWY2020_000173 [Hordeum vulgare]